MTEPATLARRFVEDATDLPQAHEIGWEEALEVYKGAQSVEQAAWLVMGYAASCVEVTYGSGALEQFAYEADTPYATLTQHRRIYLRISGLEDNDRSAILTSIRMGYLSYTHLLIANPIKDDKKYWKALAEAHDNGYGKRRFAEEVAAKRSLPLPPPLLEGDTEREEAVYEDAEEVTAERRECPHCNGEGFIYELPPAGGGDE